MLKDEISDYLMCMATDSNFKSADVTLVREIIHAALESNDNYLMFSTAVSDALAFYEMELEDMFRDTIDVGENE